MSSMQIPLPIFDRQGRVSSLKGVTLLLLAAPLAHLLWRAQVHGLGPLPLKESLHVTGDWALRFLVITLALTPAMRILSIPKLALVRRMVGVGTFFYAALHFTLFVANSKFDIAFVAGEIALRIYLLIGFVALAGLSALALTSSDSSMRRLGASWKRLHRLVYGITVFGLLHAFMQYKIDVSPAVLLSGFFVLLMSYRVMINWRRPISLASLAIAALIAGLLTMAIEFTWYAVATGVNPWRVLKANFMLAYGVRPAVIVLITGLVVGVLHQLRGRAVKPKQVTLAPQAGEA
jgi:sulfoxide reductase heme-binding subunit YedZ